MEGRQDRRISSFLICFICNGVLIVFCLSYRSLFGEVSALAPVAAGAGMTLILWLLVLRLAGRTDGGGKEVSGARVQPAGAKAEAQTAAPPMREREPSPEAAVQILAALQREGRLLDFLQEDLRPYQDDQIGAAVRTIHAGCKTALKEYLEVKPVLEAQEGTKVTIPSGFDPKAVRLTGNVTGNPPFQGVLRHRGWQTEHVRIPGTADRKDRWILAPAEVEVE